MNIEEVQQSLKTSILNIEFNKVNGESRKMRVTLMDSYLPELNSSSEKPSRVVDQDLITVWSVDDNGWRSFKKENLVSAEVSK
jgi:hypothetical protein